LFSKLFTEASCLIEIGDITFARDCISYSIGLLISYFSVFKLLFKGLEDTIYRVMVTGPEPIIGVSKIDIDSIIEASLA